MLENNPAFRASLDRLEAIDVTPVWGHQEDHSYTCSVLRRLVPITAIGRLHDLAADDAGLLDPQERREAVERCDRFLLQQYHPNWEAYRRQWPTLERNPYLTASNDFGRKPNPLHSS